MRKAQKWMSLILAGAMALSLAACGGTDSASTSSSGESAQGTEASGGTDSADSGDYKEFTCFIAFPGAEINDDNAAMLEIAKLTGATCKETWLTGQTAEEAIGVLVAGGEYPDFVVASSGHQLMMDAGAYIPIDEYWDDYPNIKNFWSESQWDQVRAEDGHIYIIPQFGNYKLGGLANYHGGEAWWIQTRVLEWAGYPEINTIDEYFDLIAAYLEENPTMPDGETTNIGFTFCTDDWRYFALENVPLFLDGYPNDGCAIVDNSEDPNHPVVMDYNTTETAHEYYGILNEMYKNGIIYPETFTASYDSYIATLSSGRVLGMIDQRWNYQSAEDSIKTQGLEGCTYVPLDIVIDESVTPAYYDPPTSASNPDVSNGLGISISCEDVEGALQFVNDLLDPEVHQLRFWGIEGQDYLVDENGEYYRDETMRQNAVDANYKASNLCPYSFFPQYSGMDPDGINAANPNDQPSEFFASLLPEEQACLEAYGVENFTGLLTPSNTSEYPWYPLWSFSNNMTSSTPGGEAWLNLAETKMEYLPQVCMADDYETAWADYQALLQERVDFDALLSELQAEVDRRMEVAGGAPTSDAEEDTETTEAEEASSETVETTEAVEETTAETAAETAETTEEASTEAAAE